MSHVEEGIDVTSGVRILECSVVTPEATVLQSPAQFIALPLYDGEIGILPGHTPLVGRLGYGEMRLREGNATQRWYLDGGFVQVNEDNVTVLTNRAIRAEDLDPEVAAENLSTARGRRANTPELLELREKAIAQARAQLRVAQHAG